MSTTDTFQNSITQSTDWHTSQISSYTTRFGNKPSLAGVRLQENFSFKGHRLTTELEKQLVKNINPDGTSKSIGNINELKQEQLFAQDRFNQSMRVRSVPSGHIDAPSVALPSYRSNSFSDLHTSPVNITTGYTRPNLSVRIPLHSTLETVDTPVGGHSTLNRASPNGTIVKPTPPTESRGTGSFGRSSSGNPRM